MSGVVQRLCLRTAWLLVHLFQQYSAARGFSRRAAEFAVSRGSLLLAAENAELSVFCYILYRIQGFSGSFKSFLIFTVYKTIKSSRCKLYTFMIIMSINGLMYPVVCFCVTGYNKFLIQLYFEVLSVNTTTPTGRGM